MYARLHVFTLARGPWNPEERDTGAQQAALAFKGLRGFKGVTFFGDQALGEYGALSLWETKADAEAADSLMRQRYPDLFDASRGAVTGPPIVRIFEVYEPKA